jgi:outer membrane protein W
VQLSGQTVRGNAKLSVSASGLNLGETDGTLDLKQYDAALHWYVVPRGSIRPYVGGGIAWIGSGKLKINADPASGDPATSVKLENKTTWLADGGVDFSVSPQVTITLAGKYTHYTAKLNTTPDDLFQNLKLNPLTIAAGIRFKY